MTSGWRSRTEKKKLIVVDEKFMPVPRHSSYIVNGSSMVADRTAHRHEYAYGETVFRR